MEYEPSMRDVLEHLMHDESAEPRELPLSLLRAITYDFASFKRIGDYGYFELYEGVLGTGKYVTVKKLLEGMDERSFENEVRYHMRMKHKNIVRLLGYCADTTQSMMRNVKGELVMVEARERLLCFEYPYTGKLDKNITDAYHGFAWENRYEIIKGICEGLSYLHQNLTVHSDLRPANVWLALGWVPKIHGFSVSKRLEENQYELFAQDFVVRPGYMAPECIEKGVFTLKTDIFSLGVLVMEILTGKTDTTVAVDDILEAWRDRFGSDWIDRPPRMNTKPLSIQDKHMLQQIRVCALIGKRCLDLDPTKRPDAVDIIEMLVENKDKFTPDEQTMEFNILQHIVAGTKEPSHLDLSLLQNITENFSEQRKVGIGGCGEVYKGILQNGVVAVKRLFNSQTIKDKMFHREVQSLITVRHENIVRFLGYCSFTKEHAFIFEGRTIMADIRERLLCFEYISNGNLENHLTDELRGLEWDTRYEIIVGICKGLLYLHNEKDIIHMDLKPANILLDDHMVPKITDFGLSRFDNNSHTETASRFISLGYCAPEYLSEGKSSSKSDIYSLGVMITELVTGTKNKPDFSRVLRRWRHRWIKSSKHTPLYYRQVTKCLMLAQSSMQIDPTDRPDILYIINELNAINMMNDKFKVIPPLEDMLRIEPLEIHFPFELDPQISHSIELTNGAGGYIAFMTKASSRRFCIEPDMGIVPPRSKGSITVTMQAQVNALPNSHYKEEEITVLSTTVDGGLAAVDITGDVFTEKEGTTVVDEVNVMVVFDEPPSADEES